MKPKSIATLAEIPPEEHAIGVYTGLALGGLILGTGTAVMFRDLLVFFTTEGLKLDTLSIFRILLFIFSAYASLACFFGLFRMISMQRMLVREVDREFKDFIMYARPLVEEVIKQRIVGEQISDRLDKVIGAGAMSEDRRSLEFGRPFDVRVPRWGEFLLFVAILANISIGLFIYLERHPWELVPYSVIILAVAWWVVMARYFGLLYEIRSQYIPAIFILLMPTLSILLRAYLEVYQTLYVVFAIIAIYVICMYFYFKYIVTGETPKPVVKALSMAGIKIAKPEELPFPLKRYMPVKMPKEEGKPLIDEIIEKIKKLIPGAK